MKRHEYKNKSKLSFVNTSGQLASEVFITKVFITKVIGINNHVNKSSI